MKNKRQMIALLFIFVFISVMVLSFIFVATHLDHKCTGAGCAVCREISYAANLFNQLKVSLLYLFGLWLSALLVCISTVKQFLNNLYNHKTPVMLKVKLTN